MAIKQLRVEALEIRDQEGDIGACELAVAVYISSRIKPARERIIPAGIRGRQANAFEI